MSELLPVLHATLDEARAGRVSALCVVVETKGSAPQAPGAMMLLRHDCTTLGTLGGGCVEQEVKRRAFQSLTTGRSALLDFVLNHDYGWDDGLICGGRMDVAVVPIGAASELAEIRHAIDECAARRPAVLPLLVEHDNRRLRYLIHLEPAPTLLIAGAGHVGTALARLAADLDFHVVVIDDRAEYANAARFPAGVEAITKDIAATLHHWPLDEQTYVVIVTRGHQHDHQALAAVVDRPAGYIGLIGSRRKTRLIFEDIRATGVTEQALECVHTPIGLAIGAVTVNEIAVSIAAQLIEHRRKIRRKLVEGPEIVELGVRIGEKKTGNL